MGFRPFDAVIGTSPLNQLSDDEVRTFCNGAHYVLKPGGRIFTIDSGYVEGHSWLTRLFTSMDRGKCDRRWRSVRICSVRRARNGLAMSSVFACSCSSTRRWQRSSQIMTDATKLACHACPNVFRRHDASPPRYSKPEHAMGPRRLTVGSTPSGCTIKSKNSLKAMPTGHLANSAGSALRKLTNERFLAKRSPETGTESVGKNESRKISGKFLT